MTEEKFKEVFVNYMTTEIAMLPNPEEYPEHPPYSRRFNRRLKRLFKKSHQNKDNLRLHNGLRYAAAVFVVVIGLIGLNQVSAAVFGFDPWKEATKIFHDDVKMDEVTYQKDETEQEGEKPISDIPTYIPEGYIVADDQSTRLIRAMEWKATSSDGKITHLAYSRIEMDEDITLYEDAEYDTVHSTEVCGFSAKIYKKTGRYRITWFDSRHSYDIWTDDISIDKRELKRIAESIYKKNEKK